jgi:hypothetical protein
MVVVKRVVRAYVRWGGLVAALALAGAWRVTAAGADPQPDPNALGKGLAADFNRWSKIQLLLPKIEGGKVVGGDAKARKLLEYVVQDYKTRAGADLLSATYSIVGGAGNLVQAGQSIGQFRAPNGPTATYFLVIGPDIKDAESASLLIGVTGKDGTRDVKSLLRWDAVANDWKAQAVDGPGPQPLHPEEVK